MATMIARVCYMLLVLPATLPITFVTALIEVAKCLWENTCGRLLWAFRGAIETAFNVYAYLRAIFRVSCEQLDSWFTRFCGTIQTVCNVTIVDYCKSITFMGIGPFFASAWSRAFLICKALVQGMYRFISYAPLIFLLAVLYILIIDPLLSFEGNLTYSLANINTIGEGLFAIPTILAFLFDGVAFVWNSFGFAFFGRMIAAFWQFITSTFENTISDYNGGDENRRMLKQETASNQWLNYALPNTLQQIQGRFGVALYGAYFIYDLFVTFITVIYDLVITVLGPIIQVVLKFILAFLTSALCIFTPAGFCVIQDTLNRLITVVPACSTVKGTPCSCGIAYGGPIINAPPCAEVTYQCDGPNANSNDYTETNLETGEKRTGSTEAIGCPNWIKTTGSSSRAKSGRRRQLQQSHRNKEWEDDLLRSSDMIDKECFNQCYTQHKSTIGWYFRTCEHKKTKKTDSEYVGACDSNGNARSFPEQILHVQHYEKFVAMKKNTTARLGHWKAENEKESSKPTFDTIWTLPIFRAFLNKLLTTEPASEIIHIRCSDVPEVDFKTTSSDFTVALYQQACVLSRIVNIYFPYLSNTLTEKKPALNAFEFHGRKLNERKFESFNSSSPHLAILWRHATLNLKDEYVNTHDWLQRLVFFHDDLLDTHKQWAISAKVEILATHSIADISKLRPVIQKIQNKTRQHRQKQRKLFSAAENLGVWQEQARGVLNFYLCPDGFTFVKRNEKRKCKWPPANYWSLMTYVRFAFFQIEMLLEDLSPLNWLGNTAECWERTKRNPSTFPYNAVNIQKFYDTGKLPDNVEFCFPNSLLRPLPYVPTFTYYPNWFLDACKSVFVRNGDESPCDCGDLYFEQGSILDDNPAMVGMVPVKYFNRLNQAFVSFMFIITRPLAYVPVITNIWYSIFSLFAFIPWYPAAIPNLLNPEYWSNGLTNSESWFCVGIHPGSLLWAIWWSFLTYIIVKCFWDFFSTLLTALIYDFFLSFADRFLTMLGVQYISAEEQTKFERAARTSFAYVYGRTRWGRILSACRNCYRSSMSSEERERRSQISAVNTLAQMSILDTLQNRFGAAQNRANINSTRETEEDVPFIEQPVAFARFRNTNNRQTRPEEGV